MGIYPMHVPFMTQIKPGELVVTKGTEQHFLAVGEGFVEVPQTHVNVLTDMALESSHIDEGAVEKAIESAKAAMKEDHAPEQMAAIQASLSILASTGGQDNLNALTAIGSPQSPIAVSMTC